MELPSTLAVDSYEHLPVSKLSATADFREVGDVTELAESVRARGVVMPILVEPDDTEPGWFLVVAGRRRLAAARLAGLDTVPCRIKEYANDEDRLEDQIVENLHRKDLTPIEEARAYHALTTLKVKQKDLAGRVGKSPSHVSKRLSLLKLPPDLQGGVDNGTIPVAYAVELARLAHHPERLAKVAKVASDANTSEGAVRVQVDRELAAVEREKKVDAKITELEDQGVAVVEFPAGGWFDGCEFKPLAVDGYADQLTSVHVTVDAHAAEPCHGATVDTFDAEVVWVCLDPSRHAVAEPADEAAAGGPSSEAAVERAPEPWEVERANRAREQAELDEAAKRRTDAVRRLLDTRISPSDALLPMIRLFLAFEDACTLAETACDLIGVDVTIPDGSSRWDFDDDPFVVALLAAAEADPAKVAVALDAADATPRYTTSFHPGTRRLYDLLAPLGYDPAPIEQRLLAEADAVAAERAARAAAAKLEEAGEPVCSTCGAPLGEGIFDDKCADHIEGARADVAAEEVGVGA